MHIATLNGESYAVANSGAVHSAQYIYNEIFIDKVYGSIEKGDVVIDVGANIGLYSKYAIDNGASKVICFEPDPDNGEMLKENVKMHSLRGKVKLIKKGVWSNSGKGEFLSYQSRKGSCCLVDCNHLPVADTADLYTISLTTLDKELINVEQVNVIKMDIEGAEMEALRGARQTILKHKPHLAISVYHNEGDYITIPLYILSLVPEYMVSTTGIHDEVMHFRR